MTLTWKGSSPVVEVSRTTTSTNYKIGSSTMSWQNLESTIVENLQHLAKSSPNAGKKRPSKIPNESSLNEKPSKKFKKRFSKKKEMKEITSPKGANSHHHSDNLLKDESKLHKKNGYNRTHLSSRKIEEKMKSQFQRGNSSPKRRKDNESFNLSQSSDFDILSKRKQVFRDQIRSIRIGILYQHKTIHDVTYMSNPSIINYEKKIEICKNDQIKTLNSRLEHLFKALHSLNAVSYTHLTLPTILLV